MFKKYFLNPSKTTKAEPITSDPVSLEDVDTPKNFAPSLHSVATLSSNRSHNSTHRSVNSMHHLTPVNDFKRSIENEKNIRQLMNKFESLASNPEGSHPKAGDKFLSVIEKNYSLQIQTLLEEVNKLKLEKKIFETKLASSMKTLPGSRTDLKDSNIESYKMTIEAKNSTIKELEFQLQQLKNENSNLKIVNEIHKSELEKAAEGAMHNGNLKCQLEDNLDEIELLRQKLELKESNQAKLMQELQQLRNENLHLKFKSQNNSFIGGSSERPTRHQSRDASFISVTEIKGPAHFRSKSEHHTWGPMKLSEIAGDLQNRTHNASVLMPQSMCSFTRKKDEISQIGVQSMISVANNKSSLASLGPNPSLKILNEYERNLLREKENNPENARKITIRLIELKKLKGHYIEQENQRLMNMLKEKKKPRTDLPSFRPDDSILDGKSTDFDLTYSINDNGEF